MAEGEPDLLAGRRPRALRRQPVPAIRPDLLALFDLDELSKYMTEDELAGLKQNLTGYKSKPSGSGPGLFQDNVVLQVGYVK